MTVLDTDTLVLLAAGHARVVERLGSAADSIVTTVITRIELLRGRFEFLLKASSGEELKRAQHWLRQTERDLTRFAVLPVDESSANTFDELRQQRRLGRIGRADLLIACIVLAHDATLVTRNVRHFREIPGLRIQNWAD